MVCRVLAALFLFLLLITGQASAQDAEPSVDAPAEDGASDDDAPAPLLRDLQLIDAELQNDALSLGDADAPVTTTPPGDSSVAEIFDRAQLAYATEDFETAYVHARNAASGGHAQAATLAGLLHENRQIDEASDAQAVRWYRRAADQTEPVALYRLGRMAQAARAGLLPTEARGYFQRAAQAGNIDAMLAYALILKASPVPQDAPFALEWAERAASQGHAEAMFQLAQMYDVWERGPGNPQAARDWYVRAAQTNHAEAALQAGLMAGAGEGGPVDTELAFAMVRQSAEAGFAPAMGQYGLMLLNGTDAGEADAATAAEWFAQGAVGGDAESRFLYAVALAGGYGVPRDPVRAYYWALMAEYEMDGSRSANVDRARLAAALETDIANVFSEAVVLDVQSEVDAYRDRISR
jgi:uncharacterized protein